MTSLSFPRRLTLAFVVAALAVALVGLNAPRPSYSQMSNPPMLFFGDVADIIVNGEPYDGVTPIEAIDEHGDVVATANVAEDGFWLIEVPLAETVRFRIGAAISVAETFVSGQLQEVALVLSAPIELPPRSVD